MPAFPIQDPYPEQLIGPEDPDSDSVPNSILLVSG